MNTSKSFLRVVLAGLWAAASLSVAGCGGSKTHATEIAYQGESQEPVDIVAPADPGESGELKALWEQIERLKQELLAKSDQDASGDESKEPATDEEVKPEDNDVGETGQGQDCLLPGDCVKFGQPPVVALPSAQQVFPRSNETNVSPENVGVLIVLTGEVDLKDFQPSSLQIEPPLPVHQVMHFCLGMGCSKDSLYFATDPAGPNKTYKVTLKKGNALASDYSWSFSTGSASASSTCSDGLQNGTETDIDCGGFSCGRCKISQMCKRSTDCTTNRCFGGECEYNNSRAQH